MPNRSQLTLSLLFTICAVLRGSYTGYRWRLNRKKYWQLTPFDWWSNFAGEALGFWCFFDRWYHRYWWIWTCWQCFFDFFFHDLWLVFMIPQGIFMVFHSIWLIFMIFKVFSCFFHFFKFTVVNDAIYFVKTSTDVFAIFLRFIDHR